MSIGGPVLGLDQVMTQQAVIERDQSSTDELGAKAARDWQELATVACFMWWGAGMSATRIGATQQRPEQTADLNIGGMVMPEGTDITARDRIARILDAAGNVIDDGRFEILAVAPFRGMTEISFRKVS